MSAGEAVKDCRLALMGWITKQGFGDETMKANKFDP